ncbi:MAG TPA: hypothetical protein VK694_02685 [Verrucomicrobiae bacterium]|nr:hypothetical protein [Verrucomicrobiae bacterium]
MDLKVVLGVCSLVVASVGYVPYINNVLRKRTKPHAYSWLVWAVLGLVGFGIQVQGKGGPGSWLLGLTVAATLFIFILSLLYGHKDIQIVDKVSLLFAGIAFVFWIATDQPLIAAVLITLVEAVGGFFPTFRKSYSNPYEETAFAYFTYATSICFSLLALEVYSLTNILYPGVVFFMNVSLFAFLLVRRSRVKPQ